MPSKNISYCPDTGQLFKAGKIVGTRNTSGYLVLRYGEKVVYAHRLAWFLTYGSWPNTIDHINRIRSDNKLCNLREVDSAGNAQNKIITSPLPGAHFHKPSGLYKSAIGFGGSQTHLGYFKDAESASAAYLAAKRKHHPLWSQHD